MSVNHVRAEAHTDEGSGGHESIVFKLPSGGSLGVVVHANEAAIVILKNKEVVCWAVVFYHHFYLFFTNFIDRFFFSCVLVHTNS